ncbi:hypothetical protein TNIN_399151 [Trichonephila inaurata madagascariensis]|uniref:Uncharacterized protein n=1 Tax=Trichonephila inaurata madagascariensis TaxID=2747483 RepID=A0A8X6XQH3_9ARAC|nr:hypothetical protein TNIN_399151 [Trichonephila inaurata madagascariensis]
MKILDKWLENISTLDTKVIERHPPMPVMSWTEFKKKRHARIWKRMSEMDRARHNFIRHLNTFNDTLIKKLLAPRKKKIQGNRVLQKKRQQLIDAKSNPPPSSKKSLSMSGSFSSNTKRSNIKTGKTSKDYQEKDSVLQDDDRRVKQKSSLKKLSKSEESSHSTLNKSKEKLREDIKDNLDQEPSKVESLPATNQNDSQENVRKKLDNLDL